MKASEVIERIKSLVEQIGGDPEVLTQDHEGRLDHWEKAAFTSLNVSMVKHDLWRHEPDDAKARKVIVAW